MREGAAIHVLKWRGGLPAVPTEFCSAIGPAEEGKEGGDPGVKSKGWGAFPMGRSHGFLGLPTKKLGNVAGGARSMYVRPGGAVCVLVGAPRTIKSKPLLDFGKS